MMPSARLFGWMMWARRLMLIIMVLGLDVVVVLVLVLVVFLGVDIPVI